MNTKHENLFVTRSPSGLILPCDTGAAGLMDPGRRKSMLQIAALTGAALVPLHANAQPENNAIWLIYNGVATQVSVESIVNNLLIPARDAIYAYMKAKADKWGFLYFMTKEGKWDHGPIRDWMSRASFGATVIALIKGFTEKGEGIVKAKAVVFSTFFSALSGALGAYFTRLVEYGTFILLHEKWQMGEVRARYLAFGTAFWMTPVLTEILYPLLVNLIWGGRRLTNGVDPTIEYALDIISAIKVRESITDRFVVHMPTVAKFDHDLTEHDALDHFVNRSTFTYDWNVLLWKRANGFAYYDMTADVTRIDNPQIPGECWIEHAATVCNKHADAEGTINVRCHTTLPPRI
jgi:hypothetical protein